MNKIPVPVAICVCVLAVVLMVFMLFRTLGQSSDSGDAKAISAQITHDNPKDELPPNANPMQGAVTGSLKK